MPAFPAQPRRLIVAASVSVLVTTLAGCASSTAPLGATGRTTPLAEPALDPRAQTTVIPLRHYRVWAAGRIVYAQFAIPINVFSVAQYQLGNRGYRPRRIGDKRPSYYVDCGPSLAATSLDDEYDVTMGVVTAFQEAGPESTAVSTLVTATAKTRDASADPVQCTSNGTLERQIVGLLATAPEPREPVVMRTSGQQISGTLGYLRMRGGVGHPDSDRGFSARLGAHWTASSHARWGIEAGVMHLNQVQDTISGICVGGSLCNIASWMRDVGLAVLTTGRIGRHGSTKPAPYAVLGAGFTVVWLRHRREGLDHAGNLLEPYTAQLTYRDVIIQVPLGIGADFPLSGSRLSVRVEGRTNWMFLGDRAGWSPGLEVGAKWLFKDASR